MIYNEEAYYKGYYRNVRALGAIPALVFDTIAGLLRTNPSGEIATSTIQELLGVKDKRTISNAINDLINAGWIERTEGNGRGKKSIYTITEKGVKNVPFTAEKGYKKCKKRVQKMQEKGAKIPPINKGINKVNKESGGDNAHEARDPHALSDTTPLNFENMEDFNLFWEMYPGDPNWQGEKENCERVWFAMSQEWRDRLIQQLRNGQRWRVRENDNPYWYLRNYNGEDVKGELPFLRQGTVAFEKWRSSNESAGIRMCLLHFEDRVAYCLYSDLQTMLDAGARLLDDNWK